MGKKGKENITNIQESQKIYICIQIYIYIYILSLRIFQLLMKKSMCEAIKYNKF